MTGFPPYPAQLHRTVRVLPRRPSIRPEREYSRLLGGGLVAGVDEAGRGPLAGPVVAAAVILDLEGRRPVGLRDSKQLTPTERTRLARRIHRMAVSVGIGMATPAEIDLSNILEATRLAASRAVAALDPAPAGLVTDALTLPAVPLPAVPLVKGDRRSASIAAASIIAKTVRDAMMDAWAKEFPEYNWQRNRGYPTPDHYEAIIRHGPTSLHRLSFSGVDFFTQEPRRSRTYQLLRREWEQAVVAGEEGSLAFPRLREKVQQASGRLPPSDLEELLRLLEPGPAGDDPECAS